MKISHEIYTKYINIYITQFYITQTITINHCIHAKLRMKLQFKNMKTVKILSSKSIQEIAKTIPLKSLFYSDISIGCRDIKAQNFHRV